MGLKSTVQLLNTLAMEMKTALALAAQARQGRVSEADRRMANIRFNRAVDRARQLGYYPKFVENGDGSVRVVYQTLEKKAEEGGVEDQHMYQHGDVDDRDFPQQEVAVIVCPNCSLHYAQEDHDTCPRCEQRARERGYYEGRAATPADFYRPHHINPFTKREREQTWLMDDKTEVVIYEDGEVLIDTHDGHKTRVRERLHRKGD